MVIRPSLSGCTNSLETEQKPMEASHSSSRTMLPALPPCWRTVDTPRKIGATAGISCLSHRSRSRAVRSLTLVTSGRGRLLWPFVLIVGVRQATARNRCDGFGRLLAISCWATKAPWPSGPGQECAIYGTRRLPTCGRRSVSPRLLACIDRVSFVVKSAIGVPLGWSETRIGLQGQ